MPERLEAMEQIEAERGASGVGGEKFSIMVELLQSQEGEIQIRSRVDPRTTYMLLETAQVEAMTTICKQEIRNVLDEVLLKRAEAPRIVVPTGVVTGPRQ